MESKNLYNLENLVEFRRDLHRHPELFFQESRTSAKIIEYLTKLGIQSSQIRRVAKTGIIVDIQGKAPPSGKPFRVALRADMDGLPIKENNPEIDYQSVTEAAHMCGHDVHMTNLVGGAAKILEKIDQIPSDKHVRLLFQPAEERIGGAFGMIQEGALIGVDEVYGCHNWPFGKPGELYIKTGYMMSCATSINITIYGKGGHSSIPELLNDPLQPAVDIHLAFRDLVKEYQQKGINFTVAIPMIKTGEAPNAISDTCVMSGVLRTFDPNFTNEFKARLKDLIVTTCNKYGCEVNADLRSIYPAVENTEKETEHVIRVAKKVLGEDKIRSDKLPVYASEDFAYFTKVVPGALYFLTSSRKETDLLHTDNFNPHEDVIPIGCEMWYRIVEDRLGLSFN